MNEYLDQYIQAAFINYISFKGNDNYYPPIANISQLKFSDIDFEIKI